MFQRFVQIIPGLLRRVNAMEAKLATAKARERTMRTILAMLVLIIAGAACALLKLVG